MVDNDFEHRRKITPVLNSAASVQALLYEFQKAVEDGQPQVSWGLLGAIEAGVAEVRQAMIGTGNET